LVVLADEVAVVKDQEDAGGREYYLVGQHDTPGTAQWRTEIGWPIFQTSSA
jgi:hypothetical protein